MVPVVCGHRHWSCRMGGDPIQRGARGVSQRNSRRGGRIGQVRAAPHSSTRGGECHGCRTGGCVRPPDRYSGWCRHRKCLLSHGPVFRHLHGGYRGRHQQGGIRQSCYLDITSGVLFGDTRHRWTRCGAVVCGSGSRYRVYVSHRVWGWRCCGTNRPVTGYWCK